ncbi:MAG: 2-oxoacid:acceptor oxidoreductase family protein [Candidatus Omnitrophica bacterium]|nr:2-oxoacid:acceptor oxidoreductase family protein [Candidatus Omnitrophota bacterium]
MSKQILVSGFGGQGILSLGKILAKAAIVEDKNATWFPSYGAEVRGGTAHCFVKISKEPIASPFVEYPDIGIILNQPSLDKYRKQFKKRCFLILNSDLIGSDSVNKGIKKISLPLNKMALECGSLKVTNIIALGILVLFNPEIIKKDSVIKVLKETYRDKEILKQNLDALEKAKSLDIKI